MFTLKIDCPLTTRPQLEVAIADFLATTMAPTTQELAKLGVIAVIRTSLNYFLGKEMETELALERERLEQEHIRLV